MQSHNLHLLLLVCTGILLRERNVLLQDVRQALHQPFLVDLHFLYFFLDVLQYPVECMHMHQHFTLLLSL